MNLPLHQQIQCRIHLCDIEGSQKDKKSKRTYSACTYSLENNPPFT